MGARSAATRDIVRRTSEGDRRCYRHQSFRARAPHGGAGRPRVGSKAPGDHRQHGGEMSGTNGKVNGKVNGNGHLPKSRIADLVGDTPENVTQGASGNVTQDVLGGS